MRSRAPTALARGRTSTEAYSSSKFPQGGSQETQDTSVVAEGCSLVMLACNSFVPPCLGNMITPIQTHHCVSTSLMNLEPPH
eukprot:70792-Pelagomonas_calceolata.AAC.1